MEDHSWKMSVESVYHIETHDEKHDSIVVNCEKARAMHNGRAEQMHCDVL